MFYHSDQFTIPMIGSDSTVLDSDVALLSGKSPCMVIDSSFSQLTNAGYVLVEETTTSPESDIFKYCAQVMTVSGNQSFDFFGCSTRCSADSDCKDDLRCVLSKSCSNEDGQT